MTNKESAAKQGIIDLILKWKLNSAEVQLQKDSEYLSEDSRRELTELLNRYRGYDKVMFSVAENSEKNPETARMMMKRVPPEILITHPSYRKTGGKVRKDDDAKRLNNALKRCDEAERCIGELNASKAADALEAAKQLVPNWESNPELSARIETLSEQNSKLSRGLEIQRRISALRETGGQSAYQKALSLLNEYDALGLEAYGIHLFDVEEDREALLRMMVRADGSSWTYRLTPSASQEIIRLEQSIRSLEDAENKNLRVLINNNSRLLTILINELEHLEPDSEQAIQAAARISELREHNRRLHTDILREVATRSDEYCGVAEKAINEGELDAARSYLKMAADTGKPAAGGGDDDYLGEVALPTAVTERIRELEQRLTQAQQVRDRVRKEVDAIRREFYNGEDFSLNRLFSWKISLENCTRDDPHAPGVEQLSAEVGERYAAALAYLMEKTAYDIDADLLNGDSESAAGRLDGVTPFFSTEEQKEFVSEQLRKINDAEALRRKTDSLNEELRRMEESAEQNMRCGDDVLKRAKETARAVSALYAEENREQPQENEAENKRILARMQLLHDSAELYTKFKNAAAAGCTEEALQAAADLENAPLYQFPAVRSALALFWRDAAVSDKTADENVNLYFARASRIAQESGDAALQSEIAEAVTAYNDRNDRGRRINLTLEALRGFYNEKNFAAGVDYINNKIEPAQRSEPQIALWADKIEQSFRMEQSERLLKEAREAFGRDDLLKAEERIAQSLDFFYTVEGAQLQKSIVSKREDEERDIRELQSFLDVDFGTDPVRDEETTAQIRYIRDRLRSVDKKNIRDLKLQGAIGTLEAQVNQLADQEAAEFNRLRSVFESRLVAGPESLAEADELLKEIESQSHINNYRSELMRMKAEKSSVERVYRSLKAVIDQAESYARMGDFKSAKRILDSYTDENFNEYPGWLSVMKQSAADRIERMDVRYGEVQKIFDPEMKQANNIIARVNKVFESNMPDAEEIFRLRTDLERQRLILEKEIQVDADCNPYLSSIAYLEEVMRWAETIAEFDFGIEFPQEVFSVEPLYQLRRVGKSLYESIPPLMIEIQPVLARENKWLERRTRVRQALQQINSCYTAPGRIKQSRFREVEAEIDNLAMLALLDCEKEALDGTVAVMKRTRRARSLAAAVVISIIIILGALYYFLPWIAAALGIGGVQ